MRREHGRKDKPDDARDARSSRDANDQPDPLEGRPDEADQDSWPVKNTEQVRERRPGALNRDEIRERTHRNKE
jgi:hypothetical protein